MFTSEMCIRDRSRELVVLMGVGKAAVEGKRTVKQFGDIATVKAEFEKLRQYWHKRIEGLSVVTPDPQFNSMMNMWSPFNCLMTFAWSRMASLIYSGERDGLGYRDTVQDFMGVMHVDVYKRQGFGCTPVLLLRCSASIWALPRFWWVWR